MGIKRRQLVLFGGTMLSVSLWQRATQGQNSRTVVTLLKQITLKVITPGPAGSGVLVRQTGSTYYFVTANHVLKNASAAEEVYVITSDGKEHRVDVASAKSDTSVDLALASFQSSHQYQIPTLGNSDMVQELDPIYIAGYPLATDAVPNPFITITDGKISSIGKQRDGYGLGYTATTQPGMSGGPVLNQAGQLVGIHGRADGERVGEVRVKTGLNWAVPIRTAMSIFSLENVRVSRPQSPATEPDAPIASESQTQSKLLEDTFSFEVVQVDQQGTIIHRKQKSAAYIRTDLGNGVMLDMVSIPAGQFLMGSPPSEVGRRDDEGPQHQVSVPAFYIGKYAVTQAQWKTIMGHNPAKFNGTNRPVENVSWDEANEFCQRLSQRTNQAYRLPSEAEWEYACRAGTTGPFYFGDAITKKLVNFSAPLGAAPRKTVNVGTLPPNTFGLYEMHGNVWEWCLDYWHDTYKGAPKNGTAWVTQNTERYRILRGGSWSFSPRLCRSAARYWGLPGFRDARNGFRLVLSLPKNS